MSKFADRLTHFRKLKLLKGNQNMMEGKTDGQGLEGKTDGQG
jgi:hypothetical protein